MMGIVFHDAKLGYVDIPKVACTSVKRAIYALEEGRQYDPKHEKMYVHDYYWSRKQELSGCEEVFSLVRDPIKRFLSAYSNRVTHHKELSSEYVNSRIGKDENLQLFHLDKMIYNPGLGQFIEFFDLYRNIGTIDWHIKPIINFLDTEQNVLLFPIENLKSFVSYISIKVEKQFTLPRTQTGGHKISVKELDSNQLDFLLDFYSEDYLFLKGFYSKESIWNEWRKG